MDPFRRRLPFRIPFRIPYSFQKTAFTVDIRCLHNNTQEQYITMVDYGDSSQLNQWLYKSPDELSFLRARANRKAREFLAQREILQQQRDQLELSQSQSAASTTAAATTDPESPSYGTNNNGNGNGNAATKSSAAPLPLPVEWFASGYCERVLEGTEPETEANNYDPGSGPWENDQERGHAFLTPQEEAVLVTFYVSKLPSLIGPLAQVPRLRRESKVTATAALLLRRFYLSNSVMLHDPKAVMVAAAFLGAKVEDVTADVRYLEEGTILMNAPVTQQEIIPTEIALLAGTHFDLLCFHPYKAVLALTEDLRTYLKSDKGKVLVQADRPLSGQDLKPMYDEARQLLDDAALSDIPLLYSPGQTGLAALMVAQDIVQQQQQTKESGQAIPEIDLKGYIRQRFEGQVEDWMDETLSELCGMLRALKQGQLETDMKVLKGVHKKLKKVRAWGKESKKKKRSADKADDGAAPDAKRVKIS
jgi:cyclin H